MHCLVRQHTPRTLYFSLITSRACCNSALRCWSSTTARDNSPSDDGMSASSNRASLSPPSLRRSSRARGERERCRSPVTAPRRGDGDHIWSDDCTQTQHDTTITPSRAPMRGLGSHAPRVTHRCVVTSRADASLAWLAGARAGRIWQTRTRRLQGSIAGLELRLAPVAELEAGGHGVCLLSRKGVKVLHRLHGAVAVLVAHERLGRNREVHAGSRVRCALGLATAELALAACVDTLRTKDAENPSTHADGQATTVRGRQR
jgi:hypothetical protein